MYGPTCYFSRRDSILELAMWRMGRRSGVGTTVSGPIENGGSFSFHPGDSTRATSARRSWFYITLAYLCFYLVLSSVLAPKIIQYVPLPSVLTFIWGHFTICNQTIIPQANATTTKPWKPRRMDLLERTACVPEDIRELINLAFTLAESKAEDAGSRLAQEVFAEDASMVTPRGTSIGREGKFCLLLCNLFCANCGNWSSNQKISRTRMGRYGLYAAFNR